jgi:hypothetical protein
MVLKKSKKETKSSEKNVVSTVISSSSTSGEAKSAPTNVKVIESVTVSTKNLPIMQEKLVQKSSNFYTTSSSSATQSSSSTSKTQQMQSQTDAFLRGERTLPDIDANRARNGTITIESVNLQNVGSNVTLSGDLSNIVSVEIESKDSYAQQKSDSNTNTRSTFNNSNDKNRNDVIGSNVANAMSGETSNTTSSYQEFSSTSSSSAMTTTKDNETKTSAMSKNVASSKAVKSADGKNVADTTTTFTSKVYDDKTKTWVIVEQSSVNEKDILLPGGVSSHQSIKSSNVDSRNLTLGDNFDNLNQGEFFSLLRACVFDR